MTCFRLVRQSRGNRRERQQVSILATGRLREATCWGRAVHRLAEGFSVPGRPGSPGARSLLRVRTELPSRQGVSGASRPCLLPERRGSLALLACGPVDVAGTRECRSGCCDRQCVRAHNAAPHHGVMIRRVRNLPYGPRRERVSVVVVAGHFLPAGISLFQPGVA